MVGASGGFAITTEATPPVTAITLTGTLPAGLTFTDHGDGTATLAGIADPGTGGAYALTFTATNGVGAPVTQAFTLNVQQTASFVSADARAFTVGFADSFLVETDGVPLAALTVSGALPGGVTFTDNGDGTATLAGTADPGTVGTYALTLTATNGVGAPVTQAFTLAVTENTPPTLDAIPDPAAIAEDAALQTVTLSGISAGAGDSQPLAVTAASSDPTVIPGPTVTYTSPGATGTLQYTPVADASGRRGHHGDRDRWRPRQRPGHAGRQRRVLPHLHGHGEPGERSADARRDRRPGADRRGRHASRRSP